MRSFRADPPFGEGSRSSQLICSIAGNPSAHNQPASGGLVALHETPAVAESGELKRPSRLPLTNAESVRSLLCRLRARLANLSIRLGASLVNGLSTYHRECCEAVLIHPRRPQRFRGLPRTERLAV
jgi:hypothetical protein